MIEYLPWDSNFFNAKIGKVLNAEKHNLKKLLIEKKKLKYDKIYLFSNNQLIASKKELILVDKKITFTKKIFEPIKPTKFSVSYTGRVTNKLIQLSLLSGHSSRFKIDPYFANKFELLYTTWLKNAINKSFADEVIVAKINSQIIGFVTAKKHGETGKIGLIAVDKNKHGKGIGKDLLKAIENWCVKNKIITNEVVTQQNNIQACEFYKSFNYSIKKVEYIYHL